MYQSETPQAGTTKNLALQLSFISDVADFKKMNSVWNFFLQKSNTDSFFLRFEWLYTWWEIYGKTKNCDLFIIIVSTADELVAIAPFYIDKGRPSIIRGRKILRLIGQSRVWKETAQSDRQDIVIASGYEERVISELSRFLYSKRAHWSAASFYAIHKESNLYKLNSIINSKIHVTEILGHSALSLSLEGTFGTFIDQQNQSFQSKYDATMLELKRYKDIEFRVSNSAAGVESALQSLSQVHCSRIRRINNGVCHFDSESYVNFHEQICSRLTDAGDVEVVSLLNNNSLLASICFFRSGNVLNGYLMGYVCGDDCDFSPIFVLTLWAVSRAINRGCRRIDFLSTESTGLDPSAQYGGQLSPLYNVKWHKNRMHAYFVKSAGKFS